jgi:hypothetical protein
MLCTVCLRGVGSGLFGQPGVLLTDCDDEYQKVANSYTALILRPYFHHLTLFLGTGGECSVDRGKNVVSVRRKTGGMPMVVDSRKSSRLL